MIVITYKEDGLNFTDFQIRDFQSDKTKVLQLLEGKNELTVSNGFFLRLLQTMVAMKLIPFQDIQFRMEEQMYELAENGQLKGELPPSHFASLPYDLAKEFLVSVR
ncbi:hypothetical protein D3C80_1570310 [compost metagenome]